MTSATRPVLALASVLAAVSALLVTAPPARAAACDYTNASGDYRWTTAANWTCGRVPTSGDEVTIAEEVSLDGSHTVSTITLNPGARLLGTSSQRLTLTGTLTWTGGIIEARIEAIGAVTMVAAGDADKEIRGSGWIRGNQRRFILTGTGDLIVGSPNYAAAVIYVDEFLVRSDVVVRAGSPTPGGITAATLNVVSTASFQEPGLIVDEVVVSEQGEALLSGGSISIQKAIGGILSAGATGGRIVTGAPLPGETSPEPTLVFLGDQDSIAVTNVTWEHHSGTVHPEGGRPVTLKGASDAPPFVWSGGAIAARIALEGDASVEILGDATSAPAFSAAAHPVGLVVNTEATIGAGTVLTMSPGTGIEVGAGGTVEQYPGSRIQAASAGGSPSFIVNSGTWSTQADPLGGPPAAIVDTAISGDGAWDVRDGTLALEGGASADIGLLRVLMAAGRATAIHAPDARVRLRGLSVETDPTRVPSPGEVVTVVQAQSLDATGMSTNGTLITPQFAWDVQATTRDLLLTALPAVDLALVCTPSCPGTAQKNRPWTLNWSVSRKGSATSTGIRVITRLPQGTSVVRYVVPAAVTCTQAAREVTCVIGQINSPVSLGLRLRSATVGNVVAHGRVVADKAIADPSQATRSVTVRITR